MENQRFSVVSISATGGGDYNQASSLLSRKVNDRLRSEIGTRTIKDIVSGTRGELMAGAKKSVKFRAG